MTGATKTLLLIAGLVVVAIVVVILWPAGDDDEPVQPKRSQPVPDVAGPQPPVPIAGFRIRRIRRLPTRAFELEWTLDPGSQRIASWQLQRWSKERSDWETKEPRYAAGVKRVTDDSDKIDGASYYYRLLAVTEDGKLGYSQEASIVFHDRAVPNPPQGLEPRWVAVDGRWLVGLTWTKDQADTVTRGYTIYADDEVAGEFREVRVDPPVLDSRFTCSVATTSRAVSFRVVAVDEIGQESVPATAELEPRPSYPSPSSVTVARAHRPRAPIVVRWEFPKDRHDLASFRIFKQNRLLAEVGASQRSWEDRLVVPDLAWVYSVRAVSTAGIDSEPAASEPFTAKRRATSLMPAPNDVTATWVREDDRLRIALRWGDGPLPASVAGYRIEAARESSDFRVVAASTPITTMATVIDPPDGAHSYRLRVLPVDKDGNRGPAVETALPSPEKLAPPPRLGDFEVVSNDNREKRLRWTWKYPALPMLRGFRIYHNKQLVVREDVLKADTRTWSSPVIEKSGFHRYSIQAVLVTGAVTEISPEQVYYEPPH